MLPALRWIAIRTPLRWQLPNSVTRIELIQLACDTLGATRYLEIGVSSGTCFSAVRVGEKIGVDPIAAEPAVTQILSQPGVSYYQMTSSEFFATEAPRALAGGVDVVFIDGLHTDRQALEDCLNALGYLTPGGIILMHDNLPRSADEAVPAPNWDEARRVNGATWDGNWTGDAWKAIVRIRSLRRDLSACVFDSDHGVAAVWPVGSAREVACTSAAIDAMSFEDLSRDPTRLLGLRPPAELRAVLAECRTRRTPPSAADPLQFR